jgi:hypothetical protein
MWILCEICISEYMIYVPGEKACELLYLGQMYNCGNFFPKQETIDLSFRTLNLQKSY